MKLKLCIFLAAAIFLSACHSSELSDRDFHGRAIAGSGPCANNPYLERFDCSLQRVQSAAIGGDPDAQYALGYMYFYGIGTVSDTETGMLWIKKSAAQGQPLAKKALMLLSHPPVKSVGQSPAKAKRSVRQAPGVADRDRALRSPVRLSRATLQRIPVSHYTIQLMGADQWSDAQTFILQHHLTSKEVMVYRSVWKGKTWYRIIYGNYTTAAAAHRAIAQLPRHLRNLHPWVKSFARVRKEMC